MSSLLRKIHPRPTVSATTPHFLKIIQMNTSRDIKLKVPNKFVRKYGKHLSEYVNLKLPSGLEWKVGVTRRDGKVWFKKGWAVFSEFNSLDYGHRLVFRYEGKSMFQVCIFDGSNTEIDYPVEETEDDDDDDDEESEDDDGEETEDDNEEAEDDHDSLEILEGFPPCPKTRLKSPSPCPRPQKRNRTINKAESNCKKQKTWHGYKSGMTREHVIALQRANAYKSQSENPSCVVHMYLTYVSQNILTLSTDFAKTHLIQQSAFATLRNLDGKTWPVKFKYENSTARFLSGWLKFVVDNGLKFGDACVFSLINDIELLFQVVFFRTKDAANCPLSPGGTTTRGRGTIDHVERKRRHTNKVESDSTLNCEFDMSSSDDDPSPSKKGSGLGLSKAQRGLTERARECSSHTSLGKYQMSKTGGKVTQRSSSLRARRVLEAANKHNHSNVHVPAGVSNSFLKQKKQTTTFQERDRSQPHGMMFEKLMKNKDSLRSRLEKKREGDSTARKYDFPPCPKTGEAIALERANAFKSKHPSFYRAIMHWHVYGLYLSVPCDFLKNHLPKQVDEVILGVLDGGTWSVRFSQNDIRRPRFTSGWSAFLQDNHLEVHDVCVFVLINNDTIKPRFDVVIFRAT